jgi:putative Flp pilus-assembly TadE/G-like protein
MQRHARLWKKLGRRGTIAPFLIISLSVFLAAFALAVNKGWLWSVREELKTAADAASLAAMQTYVDDELIRGDASHLSALLQRANQTARQFAQHNRVSGHPLQLKENAENDVRGDIVFGTMSAPRTGAFTALTNRGDADDLQRTTNSVVVQARLTRNRGTAPSLIFGALAGQPAADVQAVSVVVFDRGIRGFRPLYENVPLAPIALLSDPIGSHPLTWENQVIRKGGTDAHRFDSSINGFVSDPRGDHIHEFLAAYAIKPEHLAVSNTVILHLGTQELDRIASQLRSGLTKDDFSSLGGHLVLNETGGLEVSGQQVGPESAQAEFNSLHHALLELKNKAAIRIWPLYSTFVVGQARLTGFVAARIVSVAPVVSDAPLTFVLQATVTSRPDAITDFDLRGKEATFHGNQYVGKIRRVE